MEDLSWCIAYLKKYNAIDIPSYLPEEDVFRALMNITMPLGLSDEYYRRQDNVLKSLLNKKEISKAEDVLLSKNIALWQGDITMIQADAIVNAGNAKLLGCFRPLHHCIDNAIHSFAGLEVRRDLLEMLNGEEVPNGDVIATKGYNLPSKYIFHTVGPIYDGSKQNEEDLAKCYINSLETAERMYLETLVFCSISTGLYGYPLAEAAQLAVKAVKGYLSDKCSDIKVIFDVFSKKDYEAYKTILEKNS